MILHSTKKYRKDIDGLRAIAVIAVFTFHAGYLPNGFLGVDVFFVISGYLITRILYSEVSENRLSILDFYLRRFRRIVPLVLFFCALALVFGTFLMLPDDLENLSQSIIATLFFSNNILLCITIKDYWDVINEFKPLMHTWSLGIEEQFYILYPLFFFFLRKKINLLLPLLLSVTAISLFAYFKSNNEAYLFYLLPFRFFELSLGGVAAVLLNYNQVEFRSKFLLLILLFALLFFDLPIEFSKVEIPLICVTTLCLLITTDVNSISEKFLSHKIMLGIGKISFSIYMWHQFLFAYTRYFIIQELTIDIFAILFIITLLFSFLTYFLIETPFRNKQLVSNRKLFVIASLVSVVVLVSSFFIYFRAGVLKDFRELNISASNYERDMHAQYVRSTNNLKKEFSDEDKIKVLVYGNSFARDWTNVLLESKYRDEIEVIFVNFLENHTDLAEKADAIFLARLSKKSNSVLSKEDLKSLNQSIAKKVWCVGTKNFGVSNGIFYNFRGKDYCQQRTKMERGYSEENDKLKKEWGSRYIDLIGLLSNEENTIPVFTPDCKFISQDTRHLTQSGAKYIASLVETQLESILNLKH